MGTQTEVASDRPRVARPSLVAAVRGTPAGGVCLISAEAGWGRRTLLRESVALRDETVVLRLPPVALDGSGWRDLLRQAVGDDISAHDVVARAERADDPWLVVLDLDPRLHPQALELLTLVAHAEPTRLRTAVVTTHPLAGAFSRARMDDALVEIDQADLALTTEEAAGLLRTAIPGLTDDGVDEVVRLCDGWAAAVQAVVRQHRRRPDEDLVIWLRSHGAEALVAPWLEVLEPSTAEALLDTALLTRLSPDLVDAVVGRPNGHVLPALARAHGMLRVGPAAPRSDETWYDRHPLLTAYLRFSAAGRQGEDERHRRAAEWMGAHGLVARELEHRLLAGDAADAAPRFLEHESRLLETGEADVALRWYQTAPQVDDPATHLLREGWACALSGRAAEGMAALNRLRLLIPTATGGVDGDEARDLEAEADLLDAYFGERDGDVARVVAMAGHARASFGAQWAQNSHQLAALLHARGAALLDDHATALAILASVRDLPFAAAALGEGRRSTTEAELAWARGNVLEARSWAARYDRWFTDRTGPGIGFGYGPCVTSGLSLAEAGDTSGGIVVLEAALAYATEESDNVTDTVMARLGLAQVLSDVRRLQPAFGHLVEARAIVMERSPGGGLLPLVMRAEAALRLAAGDGVRADRIVRGLNDGVPRRLLNARLALLRATPNAAQLVREIDPTTPRERVEHAVLTAWAMVGTSPQRSEQQLIRAADLAGQLGITTALVHAPPQLLDVARRAAHHHVHDSLVTLVRMAERGRSGDVQGEAAPTDSALSRGDLQILALLPTRASNQAIADELGVSVNTIKTRLRRLYAKLEVHDRDDAIARARQLGLLGGRGPAKG